MKLRTLKPHIFAGKRRRVGDPDYEAGLSHGRLMVALGHALEVLIEAPPPTIGTYGTRMLDARAPAAGTPLLKRPPVRRKKAEAAPPAAPPSAVVDTPPPAEAPESVVDAPETRASTWLFEPPTAVDE